MRSLHLTRDFRHLRSRGMGVMASLTETEDGMARQRSGIVLEIIGGWG